MGRKTSVWLSDDVEAAWKASGLPLAELVRRGLGMAGQEPPGFEATLRRVLDEKLAGVSGGAQSGYGARGYGSGDYASEPFEDIP